MKKHLRYFFSLIVFLVASNQLMAQHVVISQYWGSVQGTGGTYNSNFVELYNPSTADVNMTGWSVQYKSATSAGTMNVMAFPANSIIKAHGYFLISLASSSSPYSSNPLPTPDAVGVTQVASSGKIALVASTTAISIPAPPAANPDTYPNVVDFLGFGVGADLVWEGSGAAGAGTGTSGTKCFERKANANSTATTMISTGVDYLNGNGYDTDDNANDFLLITNINPHNSASPIAAAFVTPSATSLDFGTSQTTATISAAQSFSLTGILSANATVSTSAPYAVSKDGTNFSTSISFTPAEIKASPSPMVYVNFTPTTTTASPGSVSIASTNATTQTVSLSGTGSAVADLTPPVNATNYPKINNLTTTSVDLLSNLNETGTTYYVLIPATGTAPTTAAQIMAGKDGNNAASASGSFAVTAANADATQTISGLLPGTAYNIYVVSQDAAATPNVQSSFNTLNISTPKLNQTITFAATASVTYGAGDFDPGATSDNNTIGITYSSSDQTVATIVANKVHIIKAGSVTITANQASNALYNAATAQTQTLTINKAALTITANDVTKSFGTTLTGGSGSVAFTSTALQNGENIGSVTIAYGTGAAASDAAGTYNGSVVASAATGGTFAASNYNINYVAGNVTVTTAPLPIITTTGTLSALSTTYGTASATGTFNVSGTNMTAGILVSPPAGFEVSTNATTGFGPTVTVGTAGTIASTPVYVRLAAATTVGNYSGNVVLSSISANNTNIATAASTVNAKSLTVTAANATKIYGASNPAFTINYSGFVGTDNAGSLTTQPQATTAATTTSAVGTYPITVSGAASPNYTFTYASGSLSVTPATLGISVANTSKTYGAANPAFAITYTGLTAGDTQASLTVAAAASTTATTSSAVGTYPITLSGASSPNYTIIYTNGTLTVGKTTLTVSAQPITLTYGTFNPVYVPTYSGFANGDTQAIITTAPTITSNASVTSNAGTYIITVSGTINLTNYTVTYSPATLTISKAALTITPDAQNRPYNSANPTLTVSYAGFVNGDDATKLSTQPTVTTTAAQASNVGTYAITASGAAATNYSITYVTGVFTVTPLARTLTFNLLPNKTYGDADFDPGASVSNGDAVTYTSSDATVATIVSGKVHIVGAGTVTITATAATNANYTTPAAVSQQLIVNKAIQTITFNTLGTQQKGFVIDTKATASSGLTVVLTTSDPLIATVYPGTLRLNLLSIGTVTVTASQPGNNNYLPATNVVQTMQVIDPNNTDAVVVHAGLSPNGDGVNDFLVIDGIKDYPDNKLTIVDRNGVKLFEKANYDNGANVFDGHSSVNGSMVVPGTYFYVLNYTVSGQSKRKIGYIILKY